MLIMKLNCGELLQQRQRGRRLVEALLAQLHKVRFGTSSDDSRLDTNRV